MPPPPRKRGSRRGKHKLQAKSHTSVASFKEVKQAPSSPPLSKSRRGFAPGGAAVAKVNSPQKQPPAKTPQQQQQQQTQKQPPPDGRKRSEPGAKGVPAAKDQNGGKKNLKLLKAPAKGVIIKRNDPTAVIDIHLLRKTANSIYRGKSARSVYNAAPPNPKSLDTAVAANPVQMIDKRKKTVNGLHKGTKTTRSLHKTAGYKSPAGPPNRRSPAENRKLLAKKTTSSSTSHGSTFTKATALVGSRGSGMTHVLGHNPHHHESSKRENAKKTGGKKKAISLMNINRLLLDGRKTPDHYRLTAAVAGSPSQLSLRSISEFYNLGQGPGNFLTVDDVFMYRGYKKLNKIDEGAFGVVSKAIRVADNLAVAVKEVDLRRKKTKRIEEMKRELFVLQKVANDNVVKLIEHFVVGQLLVIIMEFCAGGNLTSYLKETSITEQEAMFLFNQMATSIKVLHRRGIAHRDVKLNNFLLDSTRRVVKVGDFGLSVVSFRANTGVLMAKTYCGTEPYMAPELLRRNSLGVRSYNPLYADVWSLGVCLYAMLTRTFPFKMHTSQQGLLRAQVARRWRFPRFLRETLSEELKDLIWHMLDPEPDRRITMNGVMAHSWLNQNQFIHLSNPPSDNGSTGVPQTP